MGTGHPKKTHIIPGLNGAHVWCTIVTDKDCTSKILKFTCVTKMTREGAKKGISVFMVWEKATSLTDLWVTNSGSNLSLMRTLRKLKACCL